MSAERESVRIEGTFFISLWLFLILMTLTDVWSVLNRIAVALERLK